MRTAASAVPACCPHDVRPRCTLRSLTQRVCALLRSHKPTLRPNSGHAVHATLSPCVQQFSCSAPGTPCGGALLGALLTAARSAPPRCAYAAPFSVRCDARSSARAAPQHGQPRSVSASLLHRPAVTGRGASGPQNLALHASATHTDKSRRCAARRAPKRALYAAAGKRSAHLRPHRPRQRRGSRLRAPSHSAQCPKPASELRRLQDERMVTGVGDKPLAAGTRRTSNALFF